MDADGKLIDMLTGYAASHRHPFNIFLHLIGLCSEVQRQPEGADE